MKSNLIDEPEYVKAELRKRFGSVLNFEIERGLTRRSVTDVLLGRPARATAEIVAAEFGHTAASLFPSLYGQSANADNSEPQPTTHRLNADAS